MNSQPSSASLTADRMPGAIAAPPRTMSRTTRLVVDMLDRIEGGSLTLRMPDGSTHVLGHGEHCSTLCIHDEAVFGRVLASGSIGFAEAWMEGLWECDRLPDLLSLLAANRPVLAQAIHGKLWRVAGHWLWHRLRANTRRGSKQNIEAHYDLGNAFYRLWLDRSMSYSSALWPSPDASFEDAQLEKYRHALRCAGVQAGQHILEIGCGWGGLAEVACREFGARVTGVTLSHEQLAWARERARQQGFADMASFMLCDYRDLRGQFDHIVSIEMIEAVGEAFWPSYFSQLQALLKPGGRAVVQAITIDDALFDHYRKDVDFIQRYIFPGGMLPSPSAFHAQARRADLQVVGSRAFGADYARTLAEWLRRFDASEAAVRSLGFEERFLRMWRFYLAYCEAGFRARNTDVWQYVLTARSGG